MKNSIHLEDPLSNLYNLHLIKQSVKLTEYEQKRYKNLVKYCEEKNIAITF